MDGSVTKKDKIALPLCVLCRRRGKRRSCSASMRFEADRGPGFAFSQKIFAIQQFIFQWVPNNAFSWVFLSTIDFAPKWTPQLYSPHGLLFDCRRFWTAFELVSHLTTKSSLGAPPAWPRPAAPLLKKRQQNLNPKERDPVERNHSKRKREGTMERKERKEKGIHVATWSRMLFANVTIPST